MRRSRQNSTRPSARRASRFGPLLAALLAVFLQAFVVQTHVHAFAFGAPAVERSESAAAENHASDVVGAKHAGACVFCEALRSSGRATLPLAAEISAEHSVAAEASTLAIQLAPFAASHSWRSRAPPHPV
ncbi:MAG TPA: hypothetical protein VEA80_07920 [Vitreimonas sp.]|uniref:hypothetical protein n=1 Tax=Vitreimonas sp. TaxID=3069702 RepID=UPI002D61FBC6|nr:hypothetical protein [Vitreimonas sp.]HYD87386.1 hypothetical protein [Vitreimonas sp.]